MKLYNLTEFLKLNEAKKIDWPNALFTTCKGSQSNYMYTRLSKGNLTEIAKMLDCDEKYTSIMMYLYIGQDEDGILNNKNRKELIEYVKQVSSDKTTELKRTNTSVTMKDINGINVAYIEYEVASGHAGSARTNTIALKSSDLSKFLQNFDKSNNMTLATSIDYSFAGVSAN